jgi:hypothetical protein
MLHLATFGARSQTQSRLTIIHQSTLPERIKSYLTLDKRAPRVIQDAITATKQLGLKYLWINKYYINQNNPKVKSKQIKKMDLIYNSAEFIIIVAARSDKNYRLPRVNSYIREDLYKGDLRGLRGVLS